MADFTDVHSGFVGVTADPLGEAHERDVAIRDDEGMCFERARVDLDSGQVLLTSRPGRRANPLSASTSG